MQTADSLEKPLMLGKIEGRRRRGHQRMRWLDDITDAMCMNLGKLGVKDRGSCSASVHGFTKSWTRLCNWTTASSNSLILPLPCRLCYWAHSLRLLSLLFFVLNFVYYLHFIFLCLYFLFFNMFLLSIYRLLQWLSSKESAYNTEYEVSIPGWERSPGGV